MNEVIEMQESELRVVPTDTGTLILDGATMDSMLRVADLMASGKATVPAHLQKNSADCMAVVMQAIQWKMNPFAVAQKTHIVNGILGYEAQLVNAVLQSSNSIAGRFHYEYTGEGNALECRVGAVIHGESEITWGMWLAISSVTTKNSPLWKTNPKQQMGYLQVKNWARLFCPGAILGVYTPDELEVRPNMMDITPSGEVSGKPVEPEPPKELVEQAKKSATGGVATYEKFWKVTGKENRSLLKNSHEQFKADAIAADKNRTIEAKTEATEKQTDDFERGLDGEYVPE